MINVVEGIDREQCVGGYIEKNISEFEQGQEY